MARANPLIPAFNAGEYSPRMAGRVDISQYRFAGETFENFLLLQQGGFMKRPGTKFIKAVKTESLKTRLLSFVFSTVQAYIMEAGNAYFRFYKDLGRIDVADTDASITDGTFPSGLTDVLAQVWQVDATGPTYVDETADANSATDADFLPFPASEANGDYVAFGYADKFAVVTFDYANGTSGVGGAVDWEYWDGTAWSALSGVTDNTSGFTAVAGDGLTVEWTVPGDWSKTTINGSSSLYYVRAKITSTYSTNPVLDQAYIQVWIDRSTSSASISHDATNGRLSLDGAASSIAWAEEVVETTNTNQEHVLRFTVYGVAGDFIELRIGTTSTGNELIDDYELGVGEHSIAFTPTASPFYVQFRNSAAKSITIDDVSLIDDAPAELTTPYATADLPGIKYAQTADIMYLVHPSYRPRRLLRFGDASWSLEEVDFNDGPYLSTNTTATTLTPGATTGLGVSLTASSADGINDGAGFLSTDVGRLVRIKYSSAWGYAVITAVASTTSATIDVKRDFGATTAATDWRLGAWSDTTGWPRAVTFYESRSVFAGTTEQPQTVWLSQSGDFQNMQPDDGSGTVEDDDAIARTVAAQQVNSILWLLTAGKIVAGTTSNQLVLRSTLDDEPITPSNFSAKPQTTRACADAEAIAIDEAALFIQRGKRRLMAFGRVETGYRAFDLTVYAEHVTRSGAAELVYQEEPHSIVWALRDDGVLAALTYRPEQETIGWSRHILGGSFGSGDAVVESIAVIPGNATAGTEERDELWCIVKRTVNSATHRYIEVFERDHQDGDDNEDMFYVDSGITYDGSATDTITGLDHLEGETVKVLAEGAVHPDRTVASGSITLDAEYTKAQVGLGYVAKYKSYKLEGGGTIGSAITQTRRIGRLGLVLDNSLGVEIGDDESRLKEIPFRAVGDSMDTAVPPFTGEKIIEDFASETSTDPRIHIQNRKPVPTTVLAIAPHYEVSDSI